MPVVNTKGAASSQGFGEFTKSGAAAYIEDVFSTYLYKGNGSTQNISNGIDLSTKGGMVWIKNRAAIDKHCLYDTNRGALNVLSSNATDSQQVAISGKDLSAFTTSGFSLGPNYTASVNENTINHVSWTFRKQPKFFDVVTYTGNGTVRSIAHSLGSAPGCVIIKCVTSTYNWAVWHRSGTQQNQYTAYLDFTDGYNNQGSSIWGTPLASAPDMNATTFGVGSSNQVNQSGMTYVAYIFAHNAGGFGLTGTDNVISCGSYTGAAVPNAVTLGYEPQWIMIKRTDTAGYDWVMLDVMRGDSLTGQAVLSANLTDAEATYTNYCYPTATGFAFAGTNAEVNAAGGTYIYIAIRRGPMKVPTTGTSVFSPIAVNAMQGTQQTTNFPVDMQLIANRGGETRNFSAVDRLRGVSTTTTSQYLGNITSSTATESTTVVFATQNWNSTGFAISANTAETTALFHSFRRAPGFFDEVCYTGNASSPRTISHNLGVVPELIIIKKRSAVDTWLTYASGLGNTKYIELQSTAAATTSSLAWNNTSPTSTVFTISTYSNDSGGTYVAYLFATCPGVSKVGSYTGTGSTQTISCGFTGGARFVLIKRTDTIGDWYVWDTARGMVSGTDPSLLLNTTAAEVNANSIYTATGGFQIVSTAAGINASGGTYIYLAIA
jgi:hypothetical protein